MRSALTEYIVMRHTLRLRNLIWYLLFFYCLQNDQDVSPISTYKIIGDIGLTEKFAFPSVTFQWAGFCNKNIPV